MNEHTCSPPLPYLSPYRSPYHMPDFVLSGGVRDRRKAPDQGRDGAVRGVRCVAIGRPGGRRREELARGGAQS